MGNERRIARLDQNKDRESYFVEFRHPKRLGSDGKLGKKIRRGLGLDQTSAAQVVAELQRILDEEYWWSYDKKAEAEEKFDAIAVTIFYEGMEPTPPDYADRRNVIPLPDRKKDARYAYILPLGPSGAGKSTLDRHLIGTDPERHRFPATATAKTTTYDTEIILDDGPYQAVVTFLPRDQVRDLIEDCVFAAALAHVESGKPHEVARKLLEHTEQRFRLNYIVGDLLHDTSSDSFGEFDDAAVDPDDDGSIDGGNRSEWDSRLRGHLVSITKLAAAVWEETPKDAASPITDERESWEIAVEAFEQRVRDDGRFLDLVDAIEADIEERFELYKAGMTLTRDGWPITWYGTALEPNIDDFINRLKAFTSVSSARWGRLLSPLVSGLRVKGQFRPSWYEGTSLPRWVILDTEGLGHDPATATAVPTSLTSKYEMADAILLVDSAKQAMTHAATVEALRNIAASGHAAKLMICFTHFDLMDTTNLHTVERRRDRLLTSVDNAVASVGKSPAGRSVETSLRRILPSHVFFLGHLDKKLDGKSDISKGGVARMTVAELRRLSVAIGERIKPRPKPKAHPVYHGIHLGFAVQGAATDFHQRWSVILGHESHPGFSKAPWQTVKALTRRLANRWSDQFGGLAPVANLNDCLQDRIRAFLANPVGWIDDDGNDMPLEELDEKSRDEAVDMVCAAAQSALLKAIPDRLITAHLAEWAVAYSRSNYRSTLARARDMRGIFDAAARIPSDIPSRESMAFLDEMASLVSEAVRNAKGRII